MSVSEGRALLRLAKVGNAGCEALNPLKCAVAGCEAAKLVEKLVLADDVLCRIVSRFAMDEPEYDRDPDGNIEGYKRSQRPSGDFIRSFDVALRTALDDNAYVHATDANLGCFSGCNLSEEICELLSERQAWLHVGEEEQEDEERFLRKEISDFLVPVVCDLDPLHCYESHHCGTSFDFAALCWDAWKANHAGQTLLEYLREHPMHSGWYASVLSEGGMRDWIDVDPAKARRMRVGNRAYRDIRNQLLFWFDEWSDPDPEWAQVPWVARDRLLGIIGIISRSRKALETLNQRIEDIEEEALRDGLTKPAERSSPVLSEFQAAPTSTAAAHDSPPALRHVVRRRRSDPEEGRETIFSKIE